MENLNIVIQTNSEGEYIYDVYNCDVEDMAEGMDSMDGGCCTGTLEDALDMATEMAKQIIMRERLAGRHTDCTYDHDHTDGKCETHD